MAKKKKGQARRGWWGLLGLGAAGLAAAVAWRRLQGLEKQARSLETIPSRRPEVLPVPQPGSLPDGATASWIPGPGGSLRVCETYPKGTLPVIFLHDVGGRLEHWNHQLAALGPMRHGVALDLPGHGQSDRPESRGYQVDTLAESVAAVADGLRLRRFVLVGHGLGAAVAVEYAARHPDRVAGLLLVDPAGDQSRIPAPQLEQLRQGLKEDAQDELRWYYRQYLTLSSAAVSERVLGDLQDTSAEALSGATISSLDYNPLPGLERYVGPVLSVVSELNNLPHSLHNLLPELPVERLEGAGHWLMLDRPTELNALIASFLEVVREQLRPATVH